MTKNEIKPGNVVTLKSGGPKMTVGSVSGDTAYCHWFTSDENHQVVGLSVEALNRSLEDLSDEELEELSGELSDEELREPFVDSE